jgi:hypothetical protein
MEREEKVEILAHSEKMGGETAGYHGHEYRERFTETLAKITYETIMNMAWVAPKEREKIVEKATNIYNAITKELREGNRQGADKLYRELAEIRNELQFRLQELSNSRRRSVPYYQAYKRQGR